MQKKYVIWAALLLAIGGAIAFWMYFEKDRVPAPAPDVERAPQAPRSESGPRYPLPALSPVDTPPLQALPPLDDSDNYLRMDIAGIFGKDFAELLVKQALVERLVATIDNLPRSQIAERIRPTQPLATPFVALGQDGSGQFVMGEDNFSRYDALVAQLQAVDPDQAVSMYRRYYPLFQKAYEGLGYPDGYFNDRLVEVLDHLLATPDVGDNIELVRPHVLFEYADESLQRLSSGQKLLVRMGPRNRKQVLAMLRAIRERVALSAEGAQSGSGV